MDIAQNNLKRDMLESDHLYIIHASATVYFWVGKNVPEKAKKTVWTTANRFLSVKELPMELKVQVGLSSLLPMCRVFSTLRNLGLFHEGRTVYCLKRSLKS